MALIILRNIWDRYGEHPWFASEVDGDLICRFCEGWELEGHESDCPWLAMKKLFNA